MLYEVITILEWFLATPRRDDDLLENFLQIILIQKMIYLLFHTLIRIMDQMMPSTIMKMMIKFMDRG